MNHNRFAFVVPMYNASKTLLRMLHSVAGQSYENWHIELRDDCSTSEERLECANTLYYFRKILKPTQTINVVWNNEKLWEVANVLDAISRCEDDDIVCRLDADDFLCDLDALRIINDVYNVHKLDCLWTAHRWFDHDKVTNQNISGPMSPDADPYAHPWVSSHLKTFRKKLINDINDLNFRAEDGEYVKRAGDQALYLPVLKVAKNRGYLPMVTYSYYCPMKPETFQTDDAHFQRDEALFLRRRGFIK